MSEIRNYQRGDIFLATLEPRIGSEQGGTSPVIVLQNNIGNYYSPTLIISIPNLVERSIFRQRDRNYFLRSAFPILEKGLPRRGRQRSLQDFTVSRRFMINQGLGSDYILQEQSWSFRRAT